MNYLILALLVTGWITLLSWFHGKTWEFFKTLFDRHAIANKILHCLIYITGAIAAWLLQASNAQSFFKNEIITPTEFGIVYFGVIAFAIAGYLTYFSYHYQDYIHQQNSDFKRHEVKEEFTKVLLNAYLNVVLTKLQALRKAQAKISSNSGLDKHAKQREILESLNPKRQTQQLVWKTHEITEVLLRALYANGKASLPFRFRFSLFMLKGEFLNEQFCVENGKQVVGPFYQNDDRFKLVANPSENTSYPSTAVYAFQTNQIVYLKDADDSAECQKVFYQVFPANINNKIRSMICIPLGSFSPLEDSSFLLCFDTDQKNQFNEEIVEFIKVIQENLQTRLILELTLSRIIPE